MKKIVLTFATVFSSLLAVAQNSKADKLFNNWDYYGAAQIYKKEVTTKPTQENYFKLGECYRKMSKYAEALKAYDKVKSMGSYKDPMFYLYYGWMLKTAERYDDAKAAFKEYSDLEPMD